VEPYWQMHGRLRVSYSGDVSVSPLVTRKGTLVLTAGKATREPAECKAEFRALLTDGSIRCKIKLLGRSHLGANGTLERIMSAFLVGCP